MTAMLNGNRQEAARQHVRQLIEDRQPLPSGADLGRQFDRSEGWGRTIMRTVRAEHGMTDPEGLAAVAAAPVMTQAEAENGEHDLDVGPAPSAAAADPIADPVPAQPRGAYLAVWLAFSLGIGASVAANVASVEARLGAQLWGAFIPVALLLAVEAMSRPTWYRSGFWWGVARYGGTGLVALVAAVVSYQHMRALLLSYGEDPLNAAIGPLTVDGLMVTAGFALLAMRPRAGGVR